MRKDHFTAQGYTEHIVDQEGMKTDALIVGAGFGGIYLLHHLRDQLGLNVKCFEAGGDLGGTWYWNCYPGARVDLPVPGYEYSIPDVWKHWAWSCKYPDFKELRQYFNHVEEKLRVKKDIVFNNAVVSSKYNEKERRWIVKTENGKVARCTYLLLATGFATERIFPDWSGLETFGGEVHHSSFWPNKNMDMKGKRVTVAGTGAGGVQIVQNCAEQAAELLVLQRTPNLCLPMQQNGLDREEKDSPKRDQLFVDRRKTFAGFPFDFIQHCTFDDTSEEREKVFERL